MIKIKNTPNMVGISIHGDYEDLTTLHHSLSDYLRFYFDHTKRPNSYSCYETLLGLCYDIRHAFQGDRNIESVDNHHESIVLAASCIYDLDEADQQKLERERKKYQNGNLYFNVEVLYPWAIYYMFTLHTITEDYYRQKWFENDEYGYTPYQADTDLAMISYFVQLIWANLKETLPDSVMQHIWEYSRTFNHPDFYITYPGMYGEWLCTYWMIATNSKQLRTEMLPLLCLELSGIIDEEEDAWEVEDEDRNAGETEGKNIDPEITPASDPSEMTEEELQEYRKNIVKSIEAQTAKNVLETIALYDQYLEKYEDAFEVPYMDMYTFLCEIDDYIHEHGPFSHTSYDDWLDQTVGKVNWDQIVW